jgi:hypothetical protein
VTSLGCFSYLRVSSELPEKIEHDKSTFLALDNKSDAKKERKILVSNSSSHDFDTFILAFKAIHTLAQRGSPATYMTKRAGQETFAS